MTVFTDTQIERYSRHFILKEVGGEGQKKLLDGRVLVIGVGGLGSPAALYLAAAGAGTIGFADTDVVELSNLQRQVIHNTSDVGKFKVHSAREKILAMNPDVTVTTHQTRIVAENIAGIIRDYDFIIDGTDNFASKFLINDVCVMAGIPYSHGAVLQSPPPPGAIPTCAQAGVIGVLPGMIGTLQATEAIKYLLGTGVLLNNRMLVYDAMENVFTEVAIRKTQHCPVCGENPTITELHDELSAVNACASG
jgi:molybdopterin/thiamine biosynthesis adenylyltransferase